MFITESPSNLVAVDAATGRQYWRYNHELPDDLKACCGPNNRGVAILGDTLYMSTLDAHLVAIDAHTGNPGPDWNGDVRMGDNLYADSALALNGDTGEMEWYFQFTPHDMHDWDAIQVPILADLQMGGGTNWFSPSFSPRTELFYVMAFDSEAEYYIRDDTYEEGRTFTGGGSQSTGPMDHSTSAVRAIDPKTGARRGEYQVQPRSTAGVLSTATSCSVAASTAISTPSTPSAAGSCGTSPSAGGYMRRR